MTGPGAAIRVLLVDDHQMMRDGLCKILTDEEDIEVVGEAEDGRAALEMLGELQPNVVVMDVGMRQMNGIDATRWVRDHHPKVRVLALSTHSDKRYVLNMLKAGASAYVLKEAASEELLRAVRMVHRGLTYLSPEVAGVVVDHCVSPKETEESPAFSLLGAREREVLQLIAEGVTSKEIATQLHITVHTVETHRRNITKKLDLHSVAALTKFAVREGLTSLD